MLGLLIHIYIRISVFKKGPSFVPTPPKANWKEFLEDLEKFKSRLRFALYFETLKSDIEEETPTSQRHAKTEQSLMRSNNIARKSGNHALELFLNRIDEDVKEAKEAKHVGDNLTKEERSALNEMRKWSDVEIRPFDKGKGFFIDSKENYARRVESELLNTTHYQALEDTPEEAVLKIEHKIEA